MANSALHEWFVDAASKLANGAQRLGSGIANGINSIGNLGFNSSASDWTRDLGQIVTNAGNSYAASALEAQREAREWTAQREDTAVQRRVADLKAAGLNPWLALNGGSLGAAESSAASAAMSSGEGQMQMTGLVLSIINAMSSAYKNVVGTSINSIANIVKSIV